MSPLLLALTLTATEPAAATQLLDEGAVVDAVEELLAHGQDAVRIALPGVQDADPARRVMLEQALVRAVLARRREQAVTPAYLRAHLNAQAEVQALELGPEQLRALSCDHLLLAAVLDEGGQVALHLTLVLTETGAVLGEVTAPLGQAGQTTTARAPSVRAAVERVVEQVTAAVEARGADVRAHRVAVGALRAEGAAKTARLDRFAQAELSRALVARGFLVVERARLAAALDQLAIASALDETSGPQVGKLLGADSVLVGAVSDAGDAFLLNVRVVDVERGEVLGAGSALLPRDDVVTRAAVETRTPLEAAARSLVAPGWGQAYNGDDTKALVFGTCGYGGLLTTAALAVGATATSFAYDAVRPGPDVTAAQAAAQARELFGLRAALVLATAAAGGMTTMVWGGGVVDALASAPRD